METLEMLETSMTPPVAPSRDQSPWVTEQRAVCVDRIFRLGTMVAALDTTCFAAVRLFDRCMGVMRPPNARTNMLLMAIGEHTLPPTNHSNLLYPASFDIAHKIADSDVTQLSMWDYYMEGFIKGPNDFTLTYMKFISKIKTTEMTIMKAMSGPMAGPSAQDYLAECYPPWYTDVTNKDGRRASLLCSAFLYVPWSTRYNAEQIAATAAYLTMGTRPFPSDSFRKLGGSINESTAWGMGNTMVEMIDKLFSRGKDSSLYYMYNDLYSAWAVNNAPPCTKV
jgi:hypothetical protein